MLQNKRKIEKKGATMDDPQYLKIQTDLQMMMAQPGASHEESLTIIENDIPRTFPTLEFFNGETKDGQAHQ